jgi:hypothetical protein
MSKTSTFSKNTLTLQISPTLSVAHPFTYFLADVLDADVGLILDASFHLF